MSDEWEFENEEYVDRTIPENLPVQARLDEVKSHSFPITKNGETETVRKIQWWWVVESPEEYKDRRIKGECGIKMNTRPGNKFNEWSAALLGREVKIGEKVDPREFVGMRAKITVAHDADKKNPGLKYERVDDVIPIVDNYEAPPF